LGALTCVVPLMPDGPRRSMLPDPDSQKRKREPGTLPLPVETCEKCGGLIFEGDWPWCKGDRKDHER
jgi:hypothetical protein